MSMETLPLPTSKCNRTDLVECFLVKLIYEHGNITTSSTSKCSMTDLVECFFGGITI